MVAVVCDTQPHTETHSHTHDIAETDAQTSTPDTCERPPPPSVHVTHTTHTHTRHTHTRTRHTTHSTRHSHTQHTTRRTHTHTHTQHTTRHTRSSRLRSQRRSRCKCGAAASPSRDSTSQSWPMVAAPTLRTRRRAGCPPPTPAAPHWSSESLYRCVALATWCVRCACGVCAVCVFGARFVFVLY